MSQCTYFLKFKCDVVLDVTCVVTYPYSNVFFDRGFALQPLLLLLLQNDTILHHFKVEAVTRESREFYDEVPSNLTNNLRSHQILDIKACQLPIRNNFSLSSKFNDQRQKKLSLIMYII